MQSLVAALELLLNDLRAELVGQAEGEAGAFLPLRVVLELDLSENELTDAGPICLFRWLLVRRSELQCRVMRLARNRVGDASVEWLAEAVRSQHQPFEEVLLSQNRVTAQGAASLLLAMVLHPNEAYPWLHRSGAFLPARLGLDRNRVAEPAALLALLRRRTSLRFCEAECYNSESKCFTACPHVHLPGLLPAAGTAASRGKAAGRGKAASFPGDAGTAKVAEVPCDLRERIERVCAGGAWSLPAPTGSLAVPASRGGGSTGPRTLQEPTLRQELFVDEDAGAGLELEPVDDGLRICEVLDFPGQRGLCRGDVIAAVDGWPLSALHCPGDDAQNCRFGEHFHHGAHLDVLRHKPSQDGGGGGYAGAGGKGGGRGASGAASSSSLGGRGKPAHRFCCPHCGQGFAGWQPCLQHLRETGHGPAPADTTALREDPAAQARRWMSLCLSAARGETAPSARVEEAAVETQLLSARLSPELRCPALLEDLVADAVRCSQRHGCTVWVLPVGLQVRSQSDVAGGASCVAAAAAELRSVLTFHLPELASDEGQPATPAAAKTPGPAHPSAWDLWLQCMLQQQEDDGGSSSSSASAGTGDAPLNAAAPPFVLRGVTCRVASLRLLVLCGLPGSGKSTLAAELGSRLGWEVVNQDTLGSRQACMKAVRASLRSRGARVVIDRCNVDRTQRAVWLQLVQHEFGLGASEAGCVWLDVPVDECDRRVLSRFGHSSLPPKASSLQVIRGFARNWEAPLLDEGFGRVWRLTSSVDSEVFWAELRAAQDSEDLGPTPSPSTRSSAALGAVKEEAPPRVPSPCSDSDESPARDVNEGNEGKLREQLAFYLGDENLRQDAFFRAKMETSNGGWLHTDWLLTRPKVQAMGASRDDLLRALEDHPLLEARLLGDEAWVRRRFPLPPADEAAAEPSPLVQDAAQLAPCWDCTACDEPNRATRLQCNNCGRARSPAASLAEAPQQTGGVEDAVALPSPAADAPTAAVEVELAGSTEAARGSELGLQLHGPPPDAASFASEERCSGGTPRASTQQAHVPESTEEASVRRTSARALNRREPVLEPYRPSPSPASSVFEGSYSRGSAFQPFDFWRLPMQSLEEEADERGARAPLDFWRLPLPDFSDDEGLSAN